MPAGIFISYRRDESRHAAGRLAEDLSQAFGAQRIFRDIEGIGLGLEFAKALEKALASCTVMLVLIGPQWLDMPDRKRGGRRLDQADDWIRQEMATALKRDVRVVPVLLEGAVLPDAASLPEDIRALVGRQAMELSDVRWRGDLQRLVDALAKVPGFERQDKTKETNWKQLFKPPQGPNRKNWGWGVAAVVVLGAVVSALDGQHAAPPMQGLPSGRIMQACNCVGFNHAPVAPESRCASRQVLARTCPEVCLGGLPRVAYICL